MGSGDGERVVSMPDVPRDGNDSGIVASASASSNIRELEPMDRKNIRRIIRNLLANRGSITKLMVIYEDEAGGIMYDRCMDSADAVYLMRRFEYHIIKS